MTHAHRRRAHTRTAGEVPWYQALFKSFPVQDDVHFLNVCRYVEANARRAKVVKWAKSRR